MKALSVFLTACTAIVLAVAVIHCGGESNCTPSCTDKTCGQDDGCGGKCTACPAGQTCNAATWQCEGGCTPSCTGKCGGPDGCNGTCPNTCAAGQTCQSPGYTTCAACTPDCTGKCGGPDGCGSNCPNTCAAGQTCPGPNHDQCVGGTCTVDAGAWIYDDWQEASNACNYQDLVTNGDGTYLVGDVTPSSFMVTPGDGTDAFLCNLAGCAFSGTRAEITEIPDGFSDSTLRINVDVDGTLSDATHMSGTQTGTVTCTGLSCGLIESRLQITFPCVVVVYFAGHWVHAK